MAKVIVVGNEKGGAGKSTLAIHLVTGLLHQGATVAVMDLDLRQRSLGAFFANRRTWLAALARRVGFRVGPGLRDRVIYRELFPFGLTVADLSNDIRPVAVSLAHVAARQELRNLMQALGLDGGARLAA